jgi:hypothetical protein
MKPWLPLAASILLVGAAPPTDAVTKGNLRCFIALTVLADTDDPAVKQAAAAGTLYFLGRLDGRSPNLDIETAVAAEMRGMTEAEIRSLLKSCGDTIKGRGDYLIAIGKALEKLDK